MQFSANVNRMFGHMVSNDEFMNKMKVFLYFKIWFHEGFLEYFYSTGYFYILLLTH